jgi:ABC-type multidrug transport system ATPase subunit
MPTTGDAQSRVAALPSVDPAISLRGVSKRYGRETALHQLDLDIAEGEFFCLLGPSGCGKTTTLNLLGGFVAPSSGSIYIRGRQVDRLPPHSRDVNTVFQSESELIARFLDSLAALKEHAAATTPGPEPERSGEPYSPALLM